MTTHLPDSFARFAVHRGLVASIVRPKLFEPGRDSRLSVFSIQDLTYAEILEIGTQVVKNHNTAQRLYGWAEFSEADVEEVGLQVERDDVPPRHSSIVGWPIKDSERKEITLALAQRASAVVLDSPISVA